ncbi:MAG: hypothetical protein ACLFMU_01260 [Bacteroidales bacterium]
MQQLPPYINKQPLNVQEGEVHGQLTEIDGESFYCIENYNLMRPFLMSIVSSGDLWLYLSSNGGLTAGRQNYDNTLFPYNTDDKIHTSHMTTGPFTVIRVKETNRKVIWEPFSEKDAGLYQIQRNLYKNLPGNKVIFEEINHTLRLTFRYAWMSSDEFGWIRKPVLKNHSDQPREMEIFDGLLDILPWGITRQTQSTMSTLMDAYKVSEYLPEKGMALYYMSSIPVDRAEPSEALRSNVVWSTGITPGSVMLSHGQLGQIRRGDKVNGEQKIFGEKSAFILNAPIKLKAKGQAQWSIIADVAKDSSGILSLINRIGKSQDPELLVEISAKADSEKLASMVARADGKQQTGDPLSDRRHFSNTLFNIMRGGIFADDYRINIRDFLDHLHKSNPVIWEKYSEDLKNRGEITNLDGLQNYANKSGDRHLQRLTKEYLPLSFSRRHGDPSRPWNYFDIHVKNPDGSPSLNYQGNWRDIFQNWEALGFSYPAYLPGMITRFLNASTADGYNPYRITRDGFDWEVPEPDNPWASIGYWGDHQVAYLLRLMEMQEKFFPGKLAEGLNDRHYVFANLPYRIRPYAEICKDPQDTIIFDSALHHHLLKRREAEGNDGKLMHQENGELQQACFLEKIQVSLLTRLSNFVPEAGIWLNTQRPEWNDANNALAGYGTSMVSLYYIRRMVDFLIKIVRQSKEESFFMSDEVVDFHQAISKILRNNKQLLARGFRNEERKKITDQLGKAGERYREMVYRGFSGSENELDRQSLINFYSLVSDYLDQSIKINRRADGLYHSYNLMDIQEDRISINQLYLMLEGQAAILGSGILSPGNTLQLIKALFDSALWRADQQSFMLYPFRDLPGFLDKNIIPGKKVLQSQLLQHLLNIGNTDIVKQDETGGYHFNASLKNANALKKALGNLSGRINPDLVSEETPMVLELYESVFKHRFFTGRSGSFYKYEGLGSIYWHMVSKLLLALGERIIDFAKEQPDDANIPELKAYYYRIKAGIGIHKKPEDYGAFPTDPYSHTPLMMGAQQPGMTGQVKEDFLSRFNELGLIVDEGIVHLLPVLQQNDDFNEKGEASFGFCGSEILLKRNEKEVSAELKSHASSPVAFKGNKLSGEVSGKVFRRLL